MHIENIHGPSLIVKKPKWKLDLRNRSENQGVSRAHISIQTQTKAQQNHVYT